MWTCLAIPWSRINLASVYFQVDHVNYSFNSVSAEFHTNSMLVSHIISNKKTLKARVRTPIGSYHRGFLKSWLAPTRSWVCYRLSWKDWDHYSRVSSTSQMRLRGCCSNYLTNTAGVCISRAWFTPGYIMKGSVEPCHAVSNLKWNYIAASYITAILMYHHSIVQIDSDSVGLSCPVLVVTSSSVYHATSMPRISSRQSQKRQQ